MGNLKQLSLAWLMYANDNDEYFPGWEYQSGVENGYGPNWMVDMLPYVVPNITSTGYVPGGGSANANAYYTYLAILAGKGNCVFNCPSQNPHFMYTDYACNAGCVQFGQPGAGAAGEKTSIILNPSLTFMLADQGASVEHLNVWTAATGDQQDPEYNLPLAAQRHSGNGLNTGIVNFAFCDGHVAAIQIMNIPSWPGNTVFLAGGQKTPAQWPGHPVQIGFWGGMGNF